MTTAFSGKFSSEDDKKAFREGISTGTGQGSIPWFFERVTRCACNIWIRGYAFVRAFPC